MVDAVGLSPIVERREGSNPSTPILVPIKRGYVFEETKVLVKIVVEISRC